MKRPALILIVIAVLLAGGAWLQAAIGQSRGRGAAGGGGSYQVRALFDNAAFAVPGEQVRIAGATVGSITAVTVTRQNLAAVTFQISNRAFVPFHANATCEIRPQSLIAERYIDCNPGTAAVPALAQIRHGGGAGSYLLPVSRTSSSIDPDIVQSISQEPIRERLAIILDELGTGLAGHGSELNAVIRRANPALGYTDRVFRILAQQNHVLAALARDSSTVLAPLASARTQLSDFVVQADRTASATASQTAEIAHGIHLLPRFLSALRPLLADLSTLADRGTPLMNSLGQSAGALSSEFSAIVPFARTARTALVRLGNAAQQSESSLVASEPLARQLVSLGRAAQPTGAKLAQLTASLKNTGAIADLMDLLFYGTSAANGFDAYGHYVRSDALVGSCTAYARTAVPGCSSNFSGALANLSSAARASRASAAIARTTAAIARAAVKRAPAVATGRLTSLLDYLTGGGG